MMAGFKATLPFTMAALGLIIMTNQAVLHRNPITQKLPTFDKNGFDPCKSLEEYQRTVIRNRYYYYYYYNILNTINLVKRLDNPSINDQAMTPSISTFESKSKEEAIGMNHPDMPKKHLIMIHARNEMEAPQKFGKRTGANFEQYQDQDQVQDQDEDQEWERMKQGREQRLVKWRKKMLRRMG